MYPRIVVIIGNPRRDSRTHRLGRTLAGTLARELDAGPVGEVDLAVLGPAVLDPDNADSRAAEGQVLAARILVLASPTYKATYTGLLKSFLDRFPQGGLAGRSAVPILLGGTPKHSVAVEAHFTPLLRELGATVPARGLFVLEAALEGFDERARQWARQYATVLDSALRDAGEDAVAA